MSPELDREIRCKCGKFWGPVYFRMSKKCNRCRTMVKARGKLYRKDKNNDNRKNV